MKLLCVIDCLGSGGAQRQLVNIGRGLKERGHIVEFFAYYPGDHFKTQLDQAGIPVRLDVKASKFSLRPALALRRLIRCGDFTSVLAFLETPAVYAELACLGLRRVRLVVGERSTVPDGPASVSRVLKSHLHRLSHAVVANSRTQRTWLSTKFPFLESKLHCIWNGVDTNTFHPPQEADSSGELRLLGIGRVAVEKNLPRLASALRRCRDQGLSVTLDWVGRIEDNCYHSMIFGMVKDRGLATSWRWLGERRNVPDLMRQYDALISPSLWEGLPNVVCEALASGLPVLASDVSDNALLVQDERSGFLFSANDVSGMATAIMRFAQLEREERAAMGRVGRAFALRELSLESCLDSYEILLSPTEVAERTQQSQLS
jgi:glycosyltransferase involved in cell wall biosynthesis